MIRIFLRGTTQKMFQEVLEYGGVEKFPSNERHQIFDEHNKCNLGHNKNSDNGFQSQTNKTNMNSI